MAKPFRNIAVQVIQGKTLEEMQQLEGQATKWWETQGLKLISRLPNEEGFEAVRVDVWKDVAKLQPENVWGGPWGEHTSVLVFGVK